MRKVVDGFVVGLIVAWILSLFNVNSMVLEVCQSFTDIQLTISYYYIGFALIGLIGGLLKK